MMLHGVLRVEVPAYTLATEATSPLLCGATLCAHVTQRRSALLLHSSFHVFTRV